MLHGIAPKKASVFHVAFAIQPLNSLAVHERLYPVLAHVISSRGKVSHVMKQSGKPYHGRHVLEV